MSSRWRPSIWYSVATARLHHSWTRWCRSRTEKRLARTTQRVRLLQELVASQQERARRLERELYPTVQERLGVHPTLVENSLRGLAPAPGTLLLPEHSKAEVNPMLMVDRERTVLPTPEPEEEPMPPAEEQLNALLNGLDPQRS